MVFVGGGVTVGVMETEALSEKRLPDSDWLQVEVLDPVELGVAVLVRGGRTDPVCVGEKDSVKDGVEVAVGVGAGVTVSVFVYDPLSERESDSEAD